MSSRLLIASLILSTGCVDKKFQVDEAYVAENTLSAEPTPQIAIGADFGGKVVYLGADVDRRELARGERLTIVHYWKVVAPPGSEWRIFTHVVSASPDDWINADDSKLRQHHPVASWKAGEILRDTQIIPLRSDWRGNTAKLVVGLFPKGGSNEKDRMPIDPAHDDGTRSLVVVELPVLPRGQRTEAPAYVIRRTETPIVLDGKADEAAWKGAQAVPLLTVEGGGFDVAPSEVRLLWDDTHLYVLARLDDSDVASQYRTDDEPIWKEDCVELFIDADRSGRGYVELQVNPRGTLFDSWFKTQRPDGDVAWSSGMKAGITLEATLDDRDDRDKGWQVELAIPHQAVKGRHEAMKVRIPPEPGDRWRLNVVRVEKPARGNLSAASWAGITIQDFHAIDRLNTVVFADAEGNVTEGSDAGDR
jgi:Carbohydrate family 9 binding domain-like